MSSANSRFLSKTLRTNPLAKAGMSENEIKLEIAKGIIARLRTNIEDQSATITQLTASNTSKQNIIDEMIEDGCCRAFVDEIMSDAEKDCAKALQETKEAHISTKRAQAQELLCRKHVIRQDRVAHHFSEIFVLPLVDRIKRELSPHNIAVGSQAVYTIPISGQHDLYESERIALGITQGSHVDDFLQNEREEILTNIVDSIKIFCEGWIEVGDPIRIADSIIYTNYNIEVVKTAVYDDNIH